MLKKVFPFLNWKLSKADLRADLFAGLTVALVLIPQSMAYAELAGLPPWIGLYAAFLPVMLGGLWGSSNHLQTGPVAMIALLTASVLAPMAAAGSIEYNMLAAKLALLVGLIWGVVALFRLSFVINFLSRPVIEGFVHAGALIIATSQLGKILGIEMEQGGHYLTSLFSMFFQGGPIHGPSLLIGGLSAGLLVAGHRFAPRFPTALLVVALGTAAVYYLGLSDPDRPGGPVSIVGAVPEGLPRPVFAVPGFHDALELIPGALIIAFVGFMEMASVARALAGRSRQKLNLNQEMTGQTLAAFGSAFSGGFPVSGSFSRSALNFTSGAKSGLSAVFTGLFVMIFLLFFTHFLHYLPTAILAAIIMTAVLRLINFRQLASFMKISRGDGLAAWVTFAATLAFAPKLEKGIILGASFSILMHLYRMMRPNVALLGRHPDGALRNAHLHHLEVDKKPLPIRLDGRLFFANAAYFEEQVHEAIEQMPDVQHIALICNGINAMDASGAEMLKDLYGHLEHRGIQLMFVGVKNQMLSVVKASGLETLAGAENFFGTYEHAQEAVYKRLPSDFSYSI